MSSKKIKKLNSNIENVKNEMINTMELLQNKKLIYFYNPVKIETSDENQIITWMNHTSGRANCGKSFSKLDQYEFIINNGSWSCILFDGSIIRSTFTFKNNKLVGHSHLWWPSPYNCQKELMDEELELSDVYSLLQIDESWYKKINMRSPVRIDYDPSQNTILHPAVHMHTQHNECRMFINKPICFNRFLRYIFENFYPQLSVDLKNLHLTSFTYDKFDPKDELISINL